MRFTEHNANSKLFQICTIVLMYAERVAVPATLQNLLLKKPHTGHLGIQRRKLLRSYAYWPRMERDIGENMGKHVKFVPQLQKHLPLNDSCGQKQVFYGPDCLLITLKGSCYLVVMDSLFESDPIVKRRHPRLQ